MSAVEPVATGSDTRRRRRPGRRTVAGLALAAVVGAGACGAASALEPPLALSRAAASTFDDEGAVTISLAASDPEDPEVAEITSLLALKVDWSPSGGALRVLVDGQAGAEVLTDDERFCARVDLEAFQPVADWEPGELEQMREEVASGAASQLGGPMAADVTALVNGEWGCLSLAALQDLQDSLPSEMSSSTDLDAFATIADALREAADGLVDPWSVDEAGEDDELGRHLVASVDATELAASLVEFTDVLQDQLGELGALDQLEGLAGTATDLPTEERWSTAVSEALANASGEVAVDTWVKDGELTRAQVDLAAAVEAMSGESAEGATAVLTLDFDSDADLPEPGEDAVDLDSFIALAGIGLASMASGDGLLIG